MKKVHFFFFHKSEETFPRPHHPTSLGNLYISKFIGKVKEITTISLDCSSDGQKDTADRGNRFSPDFTHVLCFLCFYHSCCSIHSKLAHAKCFLSDIISVENSHSFHFFVCSYLKIQILDVSIFMNLISVLRCYCSQQLLKRFVLHYTSRKGFCLSAKTGLQHLPLRVKFSLP